MRTVMVEIPLRPRPIVVTISGDAARQAEMEGYLKGILNSLQGRAAPGSPKPLRPLVTWGSLLLVAFAALALTASVVVVVVIVLLVRSKRSRPGPPPLPPGDPG